MKMNLWITMTVLIALPVAVVLAGQMGLLSGSAPTDLGVHGDRLKPPSLTRNSVSSQATLHPDHPLSSQAQIDPFVSTSPSPSASMDLLLKALEAEPGLTIVERQADYIRATARTPWLGFVDDLEFWFNPSRGVIEVRSASRLGREDFGTNRARIERIRRVYQGLER